MRFCCVFFQAEDGIRDIGVTGVQTCALPISRTLSGGMKRRLILARALMHRPRLLILDEPTAGVDVELRLELWHYVQRINADGTTILLTTHYLEEAEQLCDEIAFINDGRIVAQGTSEALADEFGVASLEDAYLELVGR